MDIYLDVHIDTNTYINDDSDLDTHLDVYMDSNHFCNLDANGYFNMDPNSFRDIYIYVDSDLDSNIY